MSKRQTAIDTVNANPGKSFSELAALVAESVPLNSSEARTYVRWIIQNGRSTSHKADETPWLDERAAKAATKKEKTPKVPKEPKAPKPPKAPKAPKKPKAEGELADVKARNLELIKRVGAKLKAAERKGGAFVPEVKAEVPTQDTDELEAIRREEEAVIADVLATDRVPAFLGEE